jgi:hypothetical protein
MEEYSAWTVLQSKLPLFLVVLAVIISIITVRVIAHKKQRNAEKKKNEVILSKTNNQRDAA